MLENKDLIKDVIQWDIKTWSQTLIFWEENFKIQPKMKALTLGEREGGLSLWFALKSVNVTCSDLNTFSEKTYNLHKKYNVESNISYQEGLDILDLSKYPSNHFDIISFKSVLGALSKKEHQQKALNEMNRILKPGGAILFAENLEGSNIHKVFRRKFTRWNSYWRYLDFKTDQDLFPIHHSLDLKTFGFLATFGRNENQRRLLFHLDSIIKPITPKSWRYVLGGVLIK
jgi:ubiquinone/menaquinone biosynthesis C-methylase UbiE